MFLFIFKAISGNDDTIWHAQGKTTTLKKDMKKDSPGLVDIETKWNKLTKIGEVKTYENLRKQTRHDSLKALKDLKAATAVAWLGGLPTATIWFGTTRARNYILRKWSLQRKNAMSQPPLSSFKNNLGDSIQFVKTSFNSKFCQVTPPICLLIQKLFLLSYQYSASIFESPSFGGSALPKRYYAQPGIHEPTA